MLALADLAVLAVILVLSVVLSELLRPKPRIEDTRPSGIDDFKVPTATEGRVVPLIWGRVRIDGSNVVWYGDAYENRRTKRVKTGLWSGTRTTLYINYYVAFQQAICRGPGVALRAAWIADKPVFTGNVSGVSTFTIDDPEMFGGNQAGAGGYQATVEFYPGNTPQTVSNFLDTTGRQRIGTTAPRYNGTCHIVVRGLGVANSGLNSAYIGNSTTVPILAVEVERFPALFAGQTGTDNKIGTNGDCNPINAIYEVLTNTEWGLGRDPADIDVGPGSSFLSASATMIAESNGFSFILDKAVVANELLQEIERQIGGMVFRDLGTGKWRIKLARLDYTLGTQPLLDESNSELLSYTQSGWEDTTNQIQVLFNKRADDYKESYALAQDVANTLVQGAGTLTTNQVVSAPVRFPGVKDENLAANLAWRELRTLAYPLARIELKLLRSQFNLPLNSVIRWSNSVYGIVEKAMRVTSIDYGTLSSNGITIGCMEDVFYYALPSFGVPQATLWVPPDYTAAAYPAVNQVIMECPRAILFRDREDNSYGPPAWWTERLFFISLGNTEIVDITGNTVWVGAVRQGYEDGFRVLQGSEYLDNVDQFMEEGTLVSAVSAQEANPVASIQIYASGNLASSFGTLTSEEVGTSLAQLLMVDNEFMLVTGASYNPGTGILTLTNVYRGVLDSVQQAHSASARVYCLFTGGDVARRTVDGRSFFILDTTVGGESNVVSLRMYRADDEWGGAVTSVTISRTGYRLFRPYPPAATLYNGGTTQFAVPSMEGAGSGLNGFRIDVSWIRRSYDTGNEAAAVMADAAPTVSTEYQLEVRADPAGANTLVGAISAWATGNGPVQVSRADIVTAAAAGTLLRFVIRARHTDPDTSDLLQSKYEFQHDVAPTSSLTGQFYFGGGLAANVASASYTAAATGTFTLNIGATQATAAIQVSVNLGAWTTVIAAGLTTGTFSATSGDGIRVRRTVNEAPNPQFVELRNPSSTAVAYGTFKN